MEEKLFNQLIESIKQAGVIVRGKKLKTKEHWEVFWDGENNKFYNCHTSNDEEEANAIFEAFSKFKKNVYMQRVIEIKEVVRKHGYFDEDDIV